MGGSSVQNSASQFEEKGAQIIVGTPGRILDMHNRCNFFNLSKLEVLILDEADTLLDMGFKESVNQILSILPKQRRTGLFSATQTKEVKNLARAGLRNPVSVSVKVNHDPSLSTSSAATPRASANASIATPISLENLFAVCAYDRRPGRLAKFIGDHKEDKIIVFCATCACVDFYSSVFSTLAKRGQGLPQGTPITGFHGKMIQKKRNILYKKFAACDSGVMFSTDVAARGIDIPDVDWIVQLAAPKDPAFFVHRVGRTARAGRKGGALLFVTREERPYVDLLRGRGVPMRETIVYGDEAQEGIDADEDARGKTEEREELNGDDDDDDDADHGVMEGNEDDNVNDEGQMLVGNDAYDNDDADDDDSEDDEEGDDDVDGEEGYEEETPISDKGVDTTTLASAPSAPGPSSRALAPTPTSFDGRFLELMKSLASVDRAVLEAGSTAFMAFLRAYQEHICSYLFKFDRLSIGAVARGYALLRLPKIPETRGARGASIDFQTSPINTATIPYRHKEKEAARLRRLLALKEAKRREEEGQGEGGGADDGSIRSSRSKGAGGSKWVPPEDYVPPEDKKRVRNKKRSVQQRMEEEWADWAAEEGLFKKFKKGKVSREQYETCLMAESAPEVDDEGEFVVEKESGSKGPSRGGADSGSDSDEGDSGGGGHGADDDSDKGSVSSLDTNDDGDDDVGEDRRSAQGGGRGGGRGGGGRGGGGRGGANGDRKRARGNSSTGVFSTRRRGANNKSSVPVFKSTSLKQKLQEMLSTKSKKKKSGVGKAGGAAGPAVAGDKTKRGGGWGKKEKGGGKGLPGGNNKQRDGKGRHRGKR